MGANERVMVLVTITPAMILAGTTIAEPDLAAGEVAWVASGTYALADRRIDGGSVWECVKAHNGRAARPADDPQYWLRVGVLGFAAGGYYGGGLRMVGERGWDIEATGPARIWNQQQLGQALQGGSSNAGLQALVEGLTAEVTRLRAVVADGAEHQRTTAEILEDVTEDGNGMRTLSIGSRQ